MCKAIVKIGTKGLKKIWVYGWEIKFNNLIKLIYFNTLYL